MTIPTGAITGPFVQADCTCWAWVKDGEPEWHWPDCARVPSKEAPSSKPVNPDPTGWREFIQNVIDGKNYFRAGEYLKLLEQLETVTRERDERARWAEAWHRALETVATILEVPSAGSDKRLLQDIADAIQKLRDAGRANETTDAHEVRLLLRAHKQLKRYSEIDPVAIEIEQYVAALPKSPEEPKAPTRDADHCDYPDCEQHNAWVVEHLRASIEAHRKAILDIDGVGSVSDDALWAALKYSPKETKELSPSEAASFDKALARSPRKMGPWTQQHHVDCRVGKDHPGPCPIFTSSLPEKATEQLRKTRYCDYDLCPATFDPAHSNNDH